MSTAQSNEYFESNIRTAPPHKLHLMLIDGALRFGRQARLAITDDDLIAAQSNLMRAIDIVGEMLVGVRQSESDVNKRLVSLYAFLLGRLAEAKMDNDDAKLDEALGILEYERETWQLFCGQSSSPSQPEPSSDKKGDQGGVPAPLRVHRPTHSDVSSFSLEA
jgi:flagellar protein FliS